MKVKAGGEGGGGGGGFPPPAVVVGVVGRGGIPRPFQSAEGAPPARLARRAGEVEHERTC